MKFMKNLKLAVASLLSASAFALATMSGAQAAQIPYVPGQPLDSPTTPAFNVYTNVPNGVGNEADFVRVRPSTGDVTNNGASGERNALYVNGLEAACNVGDMYDVRTYVHNGANADRNDNGNGVAVAHDVKVGMNAPLDTTSTTFTFSSSISASNATGVSDTGKLYCGSKNVRLELVPSSVKVYSKFLGWNTISDSAVNGTTKIGTHVLGSGDVWACWDERVFIAYIVKVVEVPTPPAPVYVCDLLSINKLGENKYRFTVNYTAKNGATFKDVSYDFGDGTKTVDDTEVDHSYTAKNATFTVVATVNFMLNGQVVSNTGANCSKTITITKDNCPVPGKENLPKDSPDCKTDNCPVPGKTNLPKNSPDCKPTVLTATTLPNTGAGSIVAIFVAVSAAAGVAYSFVTRRING